MTKEDVQAAKRKEQIRELERKARLASWGDYVSFFTSKILGLAGLGIGGLEVLTPDTLPLVLGNPALMGGVGLALLTGKSLVKLVSSVSSVLEEKKSGG